MSIIGNPIIAAGGGGGFFVVSDTTDAAGGIIRTITPNQGTPVIQASKSVTVLSNGTQTISPDTGFDAMAQLLLTTSVSGGGGTPTKISDGTVTPSTNLQTSIAISGLTQEPDIFIIRLGGSGVQATISASQIISTQGLMYCRAMDTFMVSGVYRANSNTGYLVGVTWYNPDYNYPYVYSNGTVTIGEMETSSGYTYGWRSGTGISYNWEAWKL